MPDNQRMCFQQGRDLFIRKWEQQPVLEGFREPSQGCKHHFAVGPWTDAAQSQLCLLPCHLSHTWEPDAAVQTVCDLFWSTELKELFGSQITYLWAFFKAFMKGWNRETKMCQSRQTKKVPVGGVGWTKDTGMLHDLKILISNKTYGMYKTQAKRHTGGVLTSHSTSHFKHQAVNTTPKRQARGANTKASRTRSSRACGHYIYHIKFQALREFTV